MSTRSKIEVECPRCGHLREAKIWRTIDAQTDPEAREALLEGSLNRFRCLNCGFSACLPVELLYEDPGKGLRAWYVPLDRTGDKGFLDQIDDDGQPKPLSQSPDEGFRGESGHVHLVFSMSELARYVVFRDRLATRKRAIEGGLVACFSCGCSINNGEPYFCIQRMRRERGKDAECEEKLIMATSSLQVCAKCREKAASKDIAFPHKPLPLLKVESEGFRQFARGSGNREPAEEKAKPAQECTLCRVGIDPGDVYTLIELCEETNQPDCVKVIAVHDRLAVMCDKCALRYMVWL